MVGLNCGSFIENYYILAELRSPKFGSIVLASMGVWAVTAPLAALKMAPVVAVLTGPHPTEQLVKHVMGERVPTRMTYVCVKEWRRQRAWSNSSESLDKQTFICYTIYTRL